MTEAPVYIFQVGEQIAAWNLNYIVVEKTPDGYWLTIMQNGNKLFYTHAQMADLVKAPGVRFETTIAGSPHVGSGPTSQQSYVSMSKAARGAAELKSALVHAMWTLRDQLRLDDNDPQRSLSQGDLSDKGIRKKLFKLVGDIVGGKILIGSPRGGSQTVGRSAYSVRTLINLLREADGLKPGTSLTEHFAPKYYRRGNKGDRLHPILRTLMDEACDKARKVNPKASPSAVVRILEQRLEGYNDVAKAEGGDQFNMPDHKTVARHMKSMMKPLAHSISENGRDYAINNHAPGRSDVDEVRLGAIGNCDEYTFDLVTTAKASAVWGGLDPRQRERLKVLDDEIRARLTLVLVVDVASSEVLGFSISENTGAEPTLECLRMATRGMEREARLYQCVSDPLPAMGLGYVVIDNGTGLRNAKVIEGAAQAGFSVMVARTGRPTDKAHVERRFRTLQMEVLQMMLGYIGHKPAEHRGHDPFEKGVLPIGALKKILTRYFVDVYPNELRNGIGYGVHYPAERRAHAARTYQYLRPLDPNARRRGLGWREDVTPSKQGVRVFSGIYFNSRELQEKRHLIHPQGEKAKVFVDPDNLSIATVVLPGVPGDIEVQLSTTYFAGMTLQEALLHLRAYKKLHPQDVRMYKERALAGRKEISAIVDAYLIADKGLQSYATREGCVEQARMIFAGFELDLEQLPGTAQPGSVTSMGQESGALPLGGFDDLIEGQLVEQDPRREQSKRPRRAGTTGSETDRPSRELPATRGLEKRK